MDCLPVELIEKIQRMALMSELIEHTSVYSGACWSNGYRDLSVSEYYEENYLDIFDEWEWDSN